MVRLDLELSFELNFSTGDSSELDLQANASPPWDPLVPLSRTGHTVVALFLGLIFVLGFASNLLVLLVFARFPALWTPINLILLNISASDMLVCVFGTPLSFASSVRGTWLIGAHGCRWYGFANALFGETRFRSGIVSLVSLSFLSYERYSTVMCTSKADVSNYRKTWFFIAGSWLYSLVWTVPPLLGWSSYGPEGPGTTCSVQWHKRSASSVSYVICLFIFCLLLPLLLMVFCYSRILIAIHGVAKINQTSAQRRENHILAMVVCMVSCYMLCWMPYGVVALVATFGRADLITPVASIVPSILAKSSTVFNPIIYLLLNNQFYRCFVAFLKCGAEVRPDRAPRTLRSSKPEGRPINGVLPPYPDAAPSSSQICDAQKNTASLVLVIDSEP
uniref:Teleost multiple tissue opsin 3b n=1 Tax=Scleropages formosus TaxID=113540 RepID=A0A8C9VL84_SCLFO